MIKLLLANNLMIWEKIIVQTKLRDYFVAQFEHQSNDELNKIASSTMTGNKYGRKLTKKEK